jgi:tRNA threonylcarbamoyladenosine biosynthesis protein TsaE
MIKKQKTFTITTRSEEDTIGLGQAIGKHAKPGTAVMLAGDLGAGKTVCAKGIAKGLGYAGWEKIKSPTFTIVHEIDAPIPLFHFDVYRLGAIDELLEIGFEEYLERDGIVVVEWGDKFDDYLPPDHLSVTLAHAGEHTRKITVSGPYDLVTRLQRKV